MDTSMAPDVPLHEHLHAMYDTTLYTRSYHTASYRTVVHGQQTHAMCSRHAALASPHPFRRLAAEARSVSARFVASFEHNFVGGLLAHVRSPTLTVRLGGVLVFFISIRSFFGTVCMLRCCGWRESVWGRVWGVGLADGGRWTDGG